ncbi:MAG: ribonuclease Y [Candidatus Gracilibacteria bacterium]
MEVLIAIIGVLAGGILGAVLVVFTQKKKKADLESLKRQILTEAEEKRERMLSDARDEARSILDNARREEDDRKQQITRIEERIIQREEQLDTKLEKLEESRTKLEEKTEQLKKREEDLNELEEKGKHELERVSGLSKEQARELLMNKYEKEFEKDIIVHVRKMEERYLDEADKKAKNVISLAIQKYASEVASETMSTIVHLPDDDMKGRIIGREGRNINTFEMLTGIDVIVDDTPGSILISGFDLMRRYIAKRSLEMLIEDGRIHPARIEEVVEKVKNDTNDLVKEFGEKAVMEMGFTGLHPNLIKLIGRLRFRTSYGQNILKHSMEVGYICGQLAQEIGADVKLAKMAGFFHDIGKAVTHEIEGSHAVIGASILRKFDMDERLINCVESHHNDVEAKSIEAILTTAADAISGARPGARSDSIENYIRRLQDLENVASSFEGVKNVYAIQAGREVRVFVNPEEITDLDAMKLAQDIARKVEEELQYPGEIRINVIREQRVMEFAR